MQSRASFTLNTSPKADFHAHPLVQGSEVPAGSALVSEGHCGCDSR